MNAAVLRRALVFTGALGDRALVIGAGRPMPPCLPARRWTNPAKADRLLIIEPDNTVTIRTAPGDGPGHHNGSGHAAGRGAGCDWTKVSVEYASATATNSAGGSLYGRMQTVGSSSLRTR